jgi:putative membrane protein (TIGR04086 family)
MQYDPRQTGAPAPIEPTGFFTGIQLRPVITGVILDTIASYVLIELYFSFAVAKGAATNEEAIAAYWLTSEGLLASLLLGSLGTAIGGFYAGYKAGKLEMKHGGLVAVGSIVLSLLMQLITPETDLPDWFIGLSLTAAIPSGVLGGFLAEVFKSVTGGGRAPSSPGWPGPK